MKKISNEMIDTLSKFSGETALTIYMPTHRTPTSPNTTENQTRYKNLIREGFEKLASQTANKDFEPIRQQLEQKIDDTHFWQTMSKSLGIFVTASSVEMYNLPIEVSEQIYIGDTFDILPLLQVKTLNEPYYLFALAMHDPKLFKGDMYGLEPVDISFPSSPEEALNIDEMYISSNTVRAGSGSMQGSPHGQGDSQHAGQEERLMYFRILDGILMKSEAVDTACSFLIAATDSEATDFRSLTKLPHVIGKHLSGNRTKDNLAELHELTYDIVVEEIVSERMKGIAEQYERAVGPEKATIVAHDIEKAATEGRVDKLLISPFEQTDDSISETPDATVMLPTTDPDQKDSLLALIKTVILNGGTIEIFSRYLMPEQAKVAALFRY